MNVSAVLLATVGGFSALFALLISPQMRTYNRISVYISFFSILAVGILLESAFRSLTIKGTKHPFFKVLLALIFAIGMVDQTSGKFVPAYDSNKSDFGNDSEFVTDIQSEMAPGSMIFQLPYVPFPESKPVNEMRDYELFKGYLHSRNLGWSYGAMKGREGDLWLKDISARPTEEMLEIIGFAGFSGIYLDRLGFEDKAVTLESKLSELLGIAPIESRNGRLLFFNLTGFVARLRNSYSAEEWAVKHDLAIHPLTLKWGGGFSELETGGEKSWRWCSAAGDLLINNPLQRDRKISVEMDLVSGHEHFASMRITTPGFTDTFPVSSQAKKYSKIVSVPPGEFSIAFYCDAEPMVAPKDERVLIFKITNFKWREVE